MGKQVVEHYVNDELDSYFETEILEKEQIIKGFSSDRKLFYEEVTRYKDKKPFEVEETILNADGTTTNYTRQIKSPK